MGLISASGKMFKAVAKDGSRVMAGKLGNVSEAVASAFKNGSKVASEAAEAGYTKGINKYAKIFAEDYADTATKWQMRANRLYDKAAGRMTPAVISGSGSDAINGVVRNVDKVARNNTIKGSLIGGVGGAVGSVTGAGIGGVTAMATGADEDDTKSMILMGALAGGTAGLIAGAGSKMIRNKQATGSMWKQAAEEMSKHGGKNLPVGGGAEGLIEKVKNGGTNFADKIDNFGNNISNKYSKGAKLEQVNLINDIKRANPEMTTSKILKDLKSGEGILSGIYNENAENIAKAVHKGNILGGAAQGTLMGSAGGALIGGVAGGIDEDETFIGGALKGGLIGGTLGGIGGGVSGHFNNSARLLSNTVENVGSLFA